MKVIDLVVANLSITEDEYSYKGLFDLSHGNQTLGCDISDFENSSDTLKKIKDYFNLDEDINDIKKIILSKVIEASSISSKLAEGKDYSEDTKNKKLERHINSLDMS